MSLKKNIMSLISMFSTLYIKKNGETLLNVASTVFYMRPLEKLFAINIHHT